MSRVPTGDLSETLLASDGRLSWSISTETLPSTQPLKELLVHRELLTRELEQVFGEVVSIKFLDRSSTPRGDHIRRVIIKCGLVPMIYAETLIPADTVSRHPWLLDLGDQPLGARMCEHGKVSRSDYRFRHLAPGDPVHRRAVQHAALVPESCQRLWARRYLLWLGSCGVRITEVFLPATESLPA